MPAWLPPLLLAPFVGSVLGVLIRRLPRGEPVGLVRSRCEGCTRPLPAWELVPFLSYAWLRGRCAGCGGVIGWFHPAVELAAVLVAGWAVLATGPGPALWWCCGLGWTLLALAWIDLDYQRLPDALTLPLLLVGLAGTWALEPARLPHHAAGAVAGYAALRLLNRAYRSWRGRDGLGEGDAKLLAAGGAWLGWEALDEVMLLGALTGIGTAYWKARGGQALRASTVVPFGPGLSLGIWVMRLHGPWAGI